jgi:ABC-type lipoprotein export system ATPase subunit
LSLPPVTIPGIGPVEGDGPILILGPNGSGKTKLALLVAQHNRVSAISAQRRTWVDDSLPVQEEQQLRDQVRSQQKRWRDHSWQPTEEINFILSTLIQEHTSLLTKRNQEAIASNSPLDPVRDTKLMRLQLLWNRLYPERQLEIGGFFPKVSRADTAAVYHLREMSDGERTVLYMAARVMTAEQNIILVDEPELHMHSKLAVRFWNEAEKLRPDCRFIYVTHDLMFALSRRRARVITIQPDSSLQELDVGKLPTSVAADVLGAATLPFYAQRIVMYEGEPGKGFANDFFTAWFDGDETFALPVGARDSVQAAVAGLKSIGVDGAEVLGLVDRDFYSDEVLKAAPAGVQVLALHELESVICDKGVVTALASHVGQAPEEVWSKFIQSVRSVFQGQVLSGVIARRVRARIGDLLQGAFTGSQVVADVDRTRENHAARIAELDLPRLTKDFFKEEQQRVATAVATEGTEMLAVLPGKHLISLLASELNVASNSGLCELVVRALNRSSLAKDDPLLQLGNRIETSLAKYLPPRRHAGAEA